MQADWTASKNICFLAYINQPLSGDEKKSQAHCNHYTTKGQGTDKYVCFNEQACLQNVSLRKYGRGATYSFLSLPSSLFFRSLQLRTTLHYLNGWNSLANPPSLSGNPSGTPRSSKHPALTRMTRIDLRRGWLTPLLVLCIRSQTHHLDFSRSSWRSLRQRRSSDEPGNPISCVRLHWEEHQEHYRYSFRSRGPHGRQCY